MSLILSCQKTVNRRRSDCNSPLLQYANQNRNKGYFDDITIGVGQSNFKANRMVLSCYSTFFEEKLKVNEKFHKSVSIKDIDEESVKAIIDFIYSGEITIDQDNVLSLLNSGQKLKVVKLKEFCFEYLKSVVNSENCFTILDVANLCQNDSLKAKVYHHMSQNFNRITQSLEFKKLFKQNVVDFFSTLNENQFGNMRLHYEAIVTWTKHKEDERKMDFPDLFGLLKLDSIPKKFLIRVVSKEPLVYKNDACAKLVMEKLAQIVEEKELKFNKSSIICLGELETRSRVVEVYNLSGDAPKQYPDLPVGLVKPCSLKMNNTIVCIGGSTTTEWITRVLQTIIMGKDFDGKNSSTTTGWRVTNQVWQMNLMEKDLQWIEIASMNEKRCNMEATIYQDYLVVAGGYDGTNYLKSAETFTNNSKQWKAIASLNRPRRDHALVESEGCLFALGGWDGENALSSVERLGGLDGTWNYIQPMNSPRYAFAAVTCQNKIFAIGGRTSNGLRSITNSVEMFDHFDQKWTEVKCMNFERWGHSACVLQDKIYVVGGRNKERTNVKKIECYDVTSDKWTVVANTIDEWGWHAVVAL